MGEVRLDIRDEQTGKLVPMVLATDYDAAQARVRALEAKLATFEVDWNGVTETCRLLRENISELEAERDALRADALRWRAFRKSTGHEYDLSSGPETIGKILILKIDCTDCVKWLESGAPDLPNTLDAAMDDEIRLQEKS